MNRIACTFLIAVAALVPAARAWADDAPTPEQMDAAKKAYGEGKSLHDQGKLPEAIEKFKESYRLSKNPLLLYNIAVTLDEAKQTDSALFYYRKFLSDAPPNAAQRGPAGDRVKVLENEKLAAEMSSSGGGNTANNSSGQSGGVSGEAHQTEPPPKPHATVHFDASMFKHELVEDAPPGKPLDVTATIPEGADVQVVLYYRAEGASSFTAKPMKWHDNILIGRIPAAVVKGPSLQYYIEVRDGAGKKLAGSGKPTEPNLISIEATAQPHTFGDFVDDAPVHSTSRHDNDDSPLGGNPSPDEPSVQQPEQPTTPASKSFTVTKWSVTGGAVVLLGLSIVFDVMAGQQAKALANDSHRTSCAPDPGNPPCPFDSYDQALQNAGKRDAVLSDVTLGVGIAGAVVAGYLWYRGATHHDEPKVMVAPEVGQTFMGAAAAVRF